MSRRSLFVVGVTLVAGMIVLRWFAAEELMYGPHDVDVFTDRPYGSEVDRDAAPFFLMWTRSDGQAFYAIAADLNGDEAAAGLGNLTYRMSRIGMSVLARLLTVGREGLLVYTLPLVSLLAYGALVVTSVRLVDRMGPRSLLLALTPAAIIGTIYDSAEALGTVLLAASITASTTTRGVLAAIALGASRPSYAIGLPASRQGLAPAAAALTTGLLLQLVFVFGFGIPFAGSAGNLGLPLMGLATEWTSMGFEGRLVAVIVLAAAIGLVSFALSRHYTVWFRLTCVITAAFSLCLAAPVYGETFSPLRATAPALVLIVLAPLFIVRPSDRGDAVRSDVG